MSLVNLKKRVKVKGAWTYAAVPRKNGRFVPDRITTPGTFYIEWRQDGKRRQEAVGHNGRAALEALRVKQTELDDRPIQIDDAAAGPTLADASDAFLRDIKATKKEATHRTYSTQIRWFLKRTQKTLVSEIGREDIMALFANGREEGSDQKTVNKRVVVVLGMLRNAGYDVKLKKGDWPKTAESDIETFEASDLKKFFAACDEREFVLFSTFLYTGFRHMEVATLQWHGDIDWANSTLKVRSKPELGFAPKSYESRNVRVPRAFIDLLRSWQKQSKTSLVFPTPAHPKRPNYGGEAIDYHMLETCKRIAYSAGLNCGKCETAKGRCFDGPNCERWFLHKFRHTFATNMLRDGVDIKTLQTLLGHKSLATTEKYLKSLRVHDLEHKVENSTLAKLLTTSAGRSRRPRTVPTKVQESATRRDSRRRSPARVS